ncbi:MAG: ferrous iron transport protein B [Magnetococcales bacterium]|nr:ferrous iron transport protein B [Magnetococcales bacterium]
MSDAPRIITVALVGNPNCGKTTLFNKLADTNATVGNYPRVTVELQEKHFEHNGWRICLVDLPGIYSLTSKSPDEQISREFLREEQADVLLNILDAANLERSLFLTTQLLELGQSTVFAFNMIDEAKKQGISLALDDLSSMLGGPAIQTAAVKGKGLDLLLDAVIAQAQIPHEEIVTTPISYDTHLESSVVKIQDMVHKLYPDTLDHHQTRWLAIKLMEGDDALQGYDNDYSHIIEMVRRERYDLERSHGDSCETMFAHARFGFIHGLLSEVRTVSIDPLKHFELTSKIDSLLLHRLLGLPLFLLIMWTMFKATFSLGNIPAGWIEHGVEWITDHISALMSKGLLHDLLIDGIFAGMGAVVVFLPYILILFFFIALFSETGYLARSSFLLDRMMHTFGLHGKAFIPLVMGFGCNVPAVMASRTIESPKARLIAILINPFMSCAQRLPAFILFSGAFFAEYAGQAIFSMYMISIVTAMGAAVILSRFVIRGGTESFVMELPPYRVPSIDSILFHMWEKAYDFVRMVGGVIVIGSILIWFLQAFPQEIDYSQDYQQAITRIEAQSESAQRNESLTNLRTQQELERMSKSYLGQAGQAISPIFAPLGFDWKDTVAIVSGFFAKEVVVASYAVLYTNNADESGNASEGLRNALSQAMTPVTAFAMMVFLLLYAPCLSTVAAIKRETKSWGWAGFSILFSLSIAYLLAFAVVTVGHWII